MAFDRQDFEIEPDDESRTTAGLRFDYLWRPRTTFGLTYGWSRTRRTSPMREGEEEEVEFGLRMSRSLNSRASLGVYATRRYSDSEIRGGMYSESIAGLRFNYRI